MRRHRLPRRRRPRDALMGKGTGPEVSDRSELQIDRRPTSGEGSDVCGLATVRARKRHASRSVVGRAGAINETSRSVTYVTPQGENVPSPPPAQYQDGGGVKTFDCVRKMQIKHNFTDKWRK